MAANWLPKVFEYPADRPALDRRLHHLGQADREMERQVRVIIDRVRRQGAKALVYYAKKFDGVSLTERSLRVSPEKLKQAWRGQPLQFRRALSLAKRRIEEFHRRQIRKGWSYRDSAGATLSQRVHPLRSVGVYTPGGMAPLPSTLLMAAIPARLAGVKRIVVATPPIKRGKSSQTILAAAHCAGVKEVYQTGGPQAVAALAYGAGPVPAVDKVVGPGRAEVQVAKRLLFGQIDIDMVAGPTEILVLADSSAPPNIVAADLLCQAEHETGTSAWAVLIGRYNLDSLLGEIERQTAKAPRGEIIRAALKKNGAIVRVKTRAAATDLANQRAPEHISIITKNPRALADKIDCAGALFLGPWTPESVGDYVAGPNHVLPTGRSARFFSPLGVDDFVRTDHVVSLSRRALETLGPATAAMAEAEGLDAHAQAVHERFR